MAEVRDTNKEVQDHSLFLYVQVESVSYIPVCLHGFQHAHLHVGVDILVTHDAPFGIFDSTGGGNWGSSQQLLSAIYRSKALDQGWGHS